MLKSRFVVGLAFLSAVTLAGAANATFFTDLWQASADGSMDMHPDEGYGIASEGDYRFTKTYHHMTFMAFNDLSDGPDGIVPNKAGDTNDGVTMASWIVGKKAFAASVYLRDITHNTCSPTSPGSLYFNDPVVIVGFRVSNVGPFVDRDTITPASGFSGCCAGYTNALLEGGENAPPGWRMGVAAATSPKYSAKGDINLADPAAEYYKLSKADSLHPLASVDASQTWFATAGGGLGGFSSTSGIPGSGHFAFDWIVQKSDAMMVNSGSITTADCSGPTGGDEPRDASDDLIYGEGWFAKHIDRCIVQGLALDPEMKGLVFQSVSAPIVFPSPDGVIPGQPWNTFVGGRDQGGGGYGPYLYVQATWQGDANNNGAVNITDLLQLATTFGKASTDVGFDKECDFTCDGSADVVDLLVLADQWNSL